jgi:hypothetical protein
MLALARRLIMRQGLAFGLRLELRADLLRRPDTADHVPRVAFVPATVLPAPRHGSSGQSFAMQGCRPIIFDGLWELSNGRTEHHRTYCITRPANSLWPRSPVGILLGRVTRDKFPEYLRRALGLVFEHPIACKRRLAAVRTASPRSRSSIASATASPALRTRRRSCDDSRTGCRRSASAKSAPHCDRRDRATTRAPVPQRRRVPVPARRARHCQQTGSGRPRRAEPPAR